jgi:hypothetical protein
MTTLSLNNVVLLIAKVSLKVIIAVIRSTNKEILKINFDPSFL